MMKMTHPPSKQNSAASKAITTLVVCILIVVVPEYEQSTSVVSLSVVSRETARLGHSDRFFFPSYFFSLAFRFAISSEVTPGHFLRQAKLHKY